MAHFRGCPLTRLHTALAPPPNAGTLPPERQLLLPHPLYQPPHHSPHHACHSRQYPTICTSPPCSLTLIVPAIPCSTRLPSLGQTAAHGRTLTPSKYELINTGTNKPIHARDQPADRRKDTTYYNPEVRVKLKDNKIHRRVRGTIRGNLIHALGNDSARTADLEVHKALFNSTMTVDITDFYLNHPLERPEYYRLPAKHIPPSVLDEFDLHQYIDNGHILMQVDKTMYGLPQAGSISQDHLVRHLAQHGYTQDPHVPCLFKHTDNGVQFCLTVDDFGIKYRARPGAEHLLATLRLKYDITVDWTGKKYLGIDIDFAPDNSTVALSMPGYIAKVLQRFQTGSLPRTLSPMVYVPPEYGKRETQSVSPDVDIPLDPAAHKRCQEIVGCMLYYARAVDSSMLPAVNAIASEISRPTAALQAQIDRLLAYAATYPDKGLVYRRSSPFTPMRPTSPVHVHAPSLAASVSLAQKMLFSTSSAPPF